MRRVYARPRMNDGAEDRGNAPDDPEELFRRLVESVSAVTYVLRFGHADEAPIYVSPQSEQVVGLPPSALMVDALARNRLLHPDDRHRVWLSAAEVDLTGGDWDAEYRIALPDGSNRWIHDQARVVPGRDGGPSLWFGVLTDLTRTHEAERALADSEMRYRTLVEQVPAVVFIDEHAEAPACLYVSPQSSAILGYPPEAFRADPQLFFATIHPDDRARVGATWIESVRHRETFHCDFRFVRPDGSVVPVREDAVLIRDDAGQPLCWQGLIQDTSERERAEQETRASEARYRMLVEQVPALVYVDSNDPMPASLYVSPQVETMLGYPADAYMNDREFWWRTMHPDDRARIEAGWATSVATGAPFHAEYRFIRPDGAEVWVIDDARLIRGAEGAPVRWQGVIQDMTSRKRWENELSASSARFRALVERTPGMVYETELNDERRTLYVSPQVEGLFGYSRQEWLEQADIWIELLHPDDRETVLAALDLHNETGQPWSQEYRLIASDGRVVWVNDQAIVVRSEEGRPATWQGIMVDITAQKVLEDQLRLMNEDLELRVRARTSELAEANEMMALEIAERRRAETELREARERYRHLLEDLSAVVYVWHVGDPGGSESLSYTSPQIERLLGFTPEEWNQPSLWIGRVHPHDRQRVLSDTARAEVTGDVYDQEYRYLAKDGRIVWVHSHATLMQRDSDGRPLVYHGVLIDITERKEAERKAAEAEEQLEAIQALGPVALYDFDVEHGPPRRIVFRRVSPALGRLIGISAEELEREPSSWTKSIHPDDRKIVEGDVRDQLATGQPSIRSYRVIDPDGRIRWIHSEARCIGRDELGRPTRFQGVIVDVTHQREADAEARRSESSLHAFIAAIPGIPWVHVVEDEPGTGRTLYLGPQVERILGYTEAELLSEPDHFGRMIHPEDRARVQAASRRHDRTREPWSEEYRMIARDGQIVWFRSVGVATEDDQGRLVWRGVAFDITSSKPTETVEIPDIAATIDGA